MFKGLGDMAKLMKQAGEIQSKMAEAQARVAEIEVEGSAGAGMVTAVVSGPGEVKRLSVDPSLLGNPDEREVLEDLVVAAVNDALAKAQDAAQAELAKATEGLALPEGMKLPFG